jgi:phosphomannomutase
MTPPLVIFDVDKTLNRSKQPIEAGMADLLRTLLGTTRVAIISGGLFEELKRIVVEQLPEHSQIEHLFILPTSGGSLYVYRNGFWQRQYAETLSEHESLIIVEALRAACVETGLIDLNAPSYGERIEYRGAQVTLSALGQKAPVDEKEAWDPTGDKKQTLRAVVALRLPQYDVKTGGSTSIDVTKHGINKAYGVHRLSEYLKIPITEMLYIGDALYPGGNDEIVKETGIPTRQVSGAEETRDVIAELIAQ